MQTCPKLPRFLTLFFIYLKAKELRIPTYYVRPASIRVYNDSMIRYATRVNFDVACKMEFHNYPIDEQICEIKMESFGYTNKQMTFRWDVDGTYRRGHKFFNLA